VSRFVDDCRREWKRLRIPDAIANEMAAELTADLEEAESDGASAEELLGSGVFDARTFAASWAEERGLIHAMPTSGGLVGRTAVLVAIGLLLVTAAVGATLVIAGRPGSTSVRLAGPAPRAALIRPAKRPRLVPVPRGFRPRLSIVVPPRFEMPRGFVVGISRNGTSTVGWVLLFVGIGGAAIVSLSAWFASRRRPGGEAFG
jgi:hypothetical protein